MRRATAQDGDGGVSAADTERPKFGTVSVHAQGCVHWARIIWGVTEAGEERKIFCPEFPRFVTSFPQK